MALSLIIKMSLCVMYLVHSEGCCLQALMHITGGSGHFYLNRDPPPPYSANITYAKKQPRQIAVYYVTYFHLFAQNCWSSKPQKFHL